MQTYLGLDLGGTSLLIGEMDRQGNILKQKRYATGYFDQQTACEIIKSSLDDYIATVGWAGEDPPEAIGIGLVGRVDSEEGIWHQIDPGRTYPVALAKLLTDRYGIPCRIDNDVKSGTRAECAWGVGQHSKNFVYINIGTGIAVGTVVNGRLIRGSHFNAGEAGHTQVGVKIGMPCCCGRMDCVETIASGSGINACARMLKDRYETELCIPENGESVRFSDVLTLSEKGDPLCTVLVDNAAQAIADLIMNLVRITDPDTVVLGGGVIAQGSMLAKVQNYLHKHTMRFVTNGVVLSKLDPQYVCLLGAGAVAMNLQQ